jgi:fused signal recognition particle receptor
VIPDAPHELLLVIDVTHGQTVLPHTRAFAEYTGLTGIILSKVDSTAKGGCTFAIIDDLGVPIKFLGTGKEIEQLVPFDPESFVEALFEKE